MYSFCETGGLSISHVSDIFQVLVSSSTNQLFSYCGMLVLFVIVGFHQKKLRTIIPIHTTMAISIKKFFLFIYLENRCKVS